MNKIDSGYAAEGGFSERSQSGYAAAAPSVSVGEREVSVGDVVRTVWQTRREMIWGAASLVALSLAYLFLQRAAIPPTVAFRTGITVTMNSSEPGKYPNGSSFAATDLRSPVVLDEVFRANSLSDYGLDLGRFSDMVSVEAYSPVFDSLTDRFRTRLENKTLSFEERKAVEDEFKSAIDGLQGKGILVTLSVPESSKLPEVVAQKVVDDIPAKWAGIYVDKLGVANLPVPVSGSSIVDQSLVDDLDYPLMYDYLMDQTEKLAAQIAAIQALPGAISFVSSESGKSISDLRRELEGIDNFRLRLGLKPIVDQGLSREPLVTSVIYQNQIKSLEKDAAAQSAYSQRVSTVIGDFRSSKPGQTGVGETPTASVSSGAQFDGAFVDKIVELSKRGDGIAFEQGLLEKKLEYENANVKLNDRRERIVERLNAINQGALAGEVRLQLEAKFRSASEKAATDLNSLWKNSNVFLAELNNKRLNFDKSLYRSNELAGNFKIDRPRLLNTRFIVVVLSALFAGLLLGSLFSILKSVLSKR
jgi:hypothetical protein